MADRESDAQEPTAAGQPVTIRAGGPLEGVVTITAIPAGHGRTRVEAFWNEDGHARSDSVEAEFYEDAREIARTAADELAAGIAPDFTRD